MADLEASSVRRPRPGLLTPAFLLVGLSSLAYFTADGVLIPTVPLYVDGPLGGGDVAVGFATGSFAIAAFLLRPVTGRLGDSRGRRLLLVAGPAIFAGSVLAYEASSSVPVLTIFRILTGAGEAFFFVGAASAISDLAPAERRGEALSFFSLSLYAGIGLGPLIGESVTADGDYTAAWVLAALLCAVAILLALPVPETRPSPATPSPGRRPLVHPAGLLPGSALFASVVGMSGFFAFLALYAREVGLPASRPVFLVFSVVVLLVRSLGAKLPDRLGVRRAARGALLLDAAGLAIISFSGSPVGLYAGTVVFALGVSLAFPALMAMAVAAAPPQERGLAVGTVTAFVDLAFMGPLALGFVADAFGYPGSFLAGAGIAAAGFVLLFTPAAVRRTAR